MNNRNAKNSRLLVTIPIIFFVIGIVCLILTEKNSNFAGFLGLTAIFSPIPSIVTASFGIMYAKKAQKDGIPLTWPISLGVTEIIFSVIMLMFVGYFIIFK